MGIMATSTSGTQQQGLAQMKRATSIGLLFAACALISLALYASTPDGEAALETAEAPSKAALMASWKAKMKSLMGRKPEPSTELTALKSNFNAEKTLDGIFEANQMGKKKAAAKKKAAKKKKKAAAKKTKKPLPASSLKSTMKKTKKAFKKLKKLKKKTKKM